MYPAVLEGGAVLRQPQDEQAHVVLLAPPQAEAETPLAALQLHHEAALQRHHSWWRIGNTTDHSELINVLHQH